MVHRSIADGIYVQPFVGLGNLNAMRRRETENDETMVARKRGAREIFLRISSYVRRYPGFAIGMMACAVISGEIGSPENA